MLTHEAIEERAWMGLNALRELLADKRRDFENSLYLTSVSESEFDFLRRAALLAALVSANQAALVAGVADSSDADLRRKRGEALAHDLDVLSKLVESFARDLTRQARALNDMQKHVHRAAMPT